MEEIEKNSAEEAKKGSMLAFFVPLEVGKKLASRFSEISGDPVLPKDMHVTIGLMRGGKRAEFVNSVIEDLCSSISPFEVSITEFGVFDPSPSSDNKYVLYAKPRSDRFKDIHDHVFSIFERHEIHIDNGSFEFSPHITIKYCNEKPDISSAVNVKFSLDKISFADFGKDFHHKLRGKQ
jgi:2'-5' RNA ligase